LAQYVVSIHDGHIFATGTAKEVLKLDKTINAEAKHDKELLEKSSEAIDIPRKNEEAVRNQDRKLIVAEEIAIGAVGWGPGELTLNCATVTHSFQSGDTCGRWAGIISFYFYWDILCLTIYMRSVGPLSRGI
jgi:hypothetical protein